MRGTLLRWRLRRALDSGPWGFPSGMDQEEIEEILRRNHRKRMRKLCVLLGHVARADRRAVEGQEDA